MRLLISSLTLFPFLNVVNSMPVVQRSEVRPERNPTASKAAFPLNLTTQLDWSSLMNKTNYVN